MKPNPGGHLALEEIIGRDELISEMWEILEGRSIYMNDLRRIGKSKIMEKMHGELPTGWRSAMGDLEGIKSREELARWFYKNSFSHLSLDKKSWKKVGEIMSALGGSEIGGVLKLPDGKKFPWKEIVERTFADLNESCEKDGEKFVFFLDEIPYMLEEVYKIEGASAAIEIIDVIRGLAAHYNNIRFVLTGSVGLHHIISILKKAGYNGPALNNFSRITPGPLSNEYAQKLVKELIKGRGLKISEPIDDIARELAQMTGGVAFYIHRLIDRTDRQIEYSINDFNDLIEDELTDADEDWDLQHYYTRIGTTYYTGGGEKELALAILDSLILSGKELSLKHLFEMVKKRGVDIDEEEARGTLKLLHKDHYINKSRTGEYSFRMELVARWWKLERDL